LGRRRKGAGSPLDGKNQLPRGCSLYARIYRTMEKNHFTKDNRAAMTPAEFGALYGKSPTWSYRLIYDGTIRVIKPNGRIMIPVGEIERLNGTAHFHTKSCRRRVTSEVAP
jgi:hypothetical protein